MGTYKNIYVEPLGAYVAPGTQVTPWASEAMVSGTAEYSQAVHVNKSTGQTALLVTCAGGAADMDITYECSVDGGQTWTVPEDVNGTSLGAVVLTMGAATKYIVFSPTISEWIRFKFDPDGNTTVTNAYYIQQEEM